MDLKPQELERLEAVAVKARDDAAYRETLAKDPHAVIREDADVALTAGSKLRMLYASDADFTVVIPGDPKARPAPLVVLYEESVRDENAVFDQLSALAPHVQDLSSRCQKDPDFRGALAANPRGTLAQTYGVDVPWSFQVVDPRAADITLVLPTRGTGAPKPVIEIPSFAQGAPTDAGAQVLTIEAGGVELSDAALEAVAGGTGGSSGKTRNKSGGKG